MDDPLRKLAHAIYREFFLKAKIEISLGKNDTVLNVFANNIHRRYTR